MKKLFLIMLAGIVLFAGCKGREEKELLTADTVSIPQDKLVKTASIDFKVKSVQQSTEKINALAKQFDGMVMHHDISSNAGNSKDITVNSDSIMRVTSYESKGEMTVKIPSERMSAFTDSVSRLGIYIKNSHLDIEDKSLEYLSAEMKINNHDDLVKQQKHEEQTKESAAALLTMKDSLVNEKIKNLKIARDAEYSTINLSFSQSPTVLKEFLPGDNLSSYNLPFFKRLGAAIAFGWSLLTESILFLANLWVLFVIGAVVVIITRKYQLKRRSATPPSA